MNTNAQRRLKIALKSPIQQQLDPRHRCEECSGVLTLRDFQSYWDGDIELEMTGAVPRVCEDCAESVHSDE